MFDIKKFFEIMLAAVLAVSVTGCSKAKDTDKRDSSSEPALSSNVTIISAKKDYNPLTGEALADGESAFSRPRAVMINNAKIALPQSGLTDADIIYEMVTEGGVTRLMALYQNVDSITGRVGPVRSARDQFIEFVLPLNAIYTHIGTSTSAKRMLNFYSYQDIDGIYLGFMSFDYDSELAKTKSSEHCWFTTSKLIKAGMERNGVSSDQTGFYPAFTFVRYDEEPRAIERTEEENNQAMTISYAYSNYADVSFTYDEATGKYLKSAFGAPHVDAETGEQLRFTNVFLILCPIGIEADNGVLPEFYLDSGDGFYFYGGKMQRITWTKEQPEDPLMIYDESGEVLTVNVGKSYVGVLDTTRSDTIVVTDETGESVEGVVRVQ